MSPVWYHILHLIALFTLVGFTAGAIFSPLKERKRLFLAATGIASLVILISGFALSGKLGIGFPGWVLVKVACWLALSLGVSLVYRVSPKAAAVVTSFSVVIAVFMVYLRPL